MTNFNKPQFITFEGGEGSGKSTQSKMLYEYLLSKGIKSILTREVGGTAEAEKIRNLLVHCELFPISELMLVMSARYEHINKVIIPALLKGSWVICDRFVDSTACYQSGDNGLPLEDIYELHEKLMTMNNDNRDRMEIARGASPSKNLPCLNQQRGIMPDLTFFMDIDPKIGLDRASERGQANKFEEKNIEFHKKVYDNIKIIKNMHKDRFISINCGNKSIQDIHENIIKKIFNHK